LNWKNFLNSLLCTLIVCIFLTGCEKPGGLDEECNAGLTGKFKLIVRLKHENHWVVNLKNYRDTLYVKFNSSEMPGMDPTDYDAVFIGDYPGDSVVIRNLSCGKYYLFATGLESFHQVRVFGGIPFEVKKNTGERNIVIPVTD
jgi:hypothetical protein